MDRRDGEPERLKARVEGRDWVAAGSGTEVEGQEAAVQAATNDANGPVNSGSKGP